MKIKLRNNRWTAIMISAVMTLCSLSISAPVTSSAAALSLISAKDSDIEYLFDHDKTATEQLEDLFTTIDLMDTTIAKLQDEMERGNVTAGTITQMYIDRINAYDNKLNSVIWINPNALSDAKKLDEERKEGNVRGPLHGIPIIVKDNYNVKGMPTSAGCLALADMIAKEDSFTVKKLREAGAVILAKANMSEFACSAIDSTSTLGGMAHNPYDLKRTAAGSSGGSAVAVAADFAMAALGTDTGGSIRNPSSYNNLYGIRPSKGLTSIEGVIPLMASRDTTGPMARTAEDLALVLEAMAGTDEHDDYTVEADADKLLGEGYSKGLSDEGLKGKRIAFLESSFSFDNSRWFPVQGEDYSDWIPTYFPDDTGENGESGESGNNGENGESGESGNNGETGESGDPGESGGQEPAPGPTVLEMAERTKQMTNRARVVLRKAGAEIINLSDILPDRLLVYPLSYANVDSNTEYDINEYLKSMGDNAHYKNVKEIIKTGKQIGFSFLDDMIDHNQDLSDTSVVPESPYTENVNGFMRGISWQYALDMRKKVAQILKDNDIDAIMYAGFNDVAYDLETENLDNFEMSYYIYLFGPCLGMPEISIPMGFSDTTSGSSVEMPLGLEIIGNYGDEKTLMEIAYAYEQSAGSGIRRIPASTPALRDNNLNAFLDTLMDEVYSIDYSLYNRKPEGKVQLMYNDYNKAAAVDKEDPYEVYSAALSLSKSYDKVIEALDESGLAPVPTVMPTSGPAAEPVPVSLPPVMGIGAAEITDSASQTNPAAVVSESKAQLKVKSKTLKKGKMYKIVVLNKNGQKVSFSVWDADIKNKIKKSLISISSAGKIKVTGKAEKGTYIIKVNVKKSSRYKAKVLKFKLKVA